MPRAYPPVMRILVGLTLALGILLPTSSAQAAGRRVTLSLPHGAQVQIAALRDGYTVGLSIEGIDGHALQRALEPLHAQSSKILRVGDKDSIAYLQFAEPVTAARVSLAPTAAGRKNKKGAAAPAAVAATPAATAPGANAAAPAAGSIAPVPAATAPAPVAVTSLPNKKKGGSKAAALLLVHIDIEHDNPRDIVLAHVLHEALPLPVMLEHHPLQDADQKFIEQKLGEAELMLNDFAHSDILHAWVSVRLGDLAVYHGQQQQACQHYTDAQRDGEVRVASQLAALRARVLRCKAPGAVPWEILLTRAGPDDPVGRRMAREAQWALSYERNANILSQALAVNNDSKHKALPNALQQALLARLLRQQDAFGFITKSMQAELLQRHGEAFDLAIDLGMDWCALDVPQAWPGTASTAKSWMTLNKKRRNKIIAATRACALADNGVAAARLARAQPLALHKQLASLTSRLAQAEAAVRAQERANDKPLLPAAAASKEAS